MTPNKLALAFSRLHVAITTSQASAVLGPLRPHDTRPKPDLEALLHTFAALTTSQAQFGEADHALLAAFGLRDVTEPAWWAGLIAGCTRGTMNDDMASMIEGIHARLQIGAESFPALAGLIDTQRAGAPMEAGGVVLLLPGLDGASPALSRVASAIEALNQLWTVAEDLTGYRGALRLVGMEPGPTTALHFDGLAEPLAELRSLLSSIWDQTARLPKIPPEQHPALVSEMLPVMHRIGQSGRSDALRVRGALEAGVRRLLEAGCTLPAAKAADAPGPKPAAVNLVAPAAAWGKAPVAGGAAADDTSHLAAVIAEERSQLRQADPARKTWQDASAAQSA